MRKPFHIYIFSTFLLFFCSCGSKDKETQTPPQQEQNIDEVRSLSEYNFTDSLTQGSHRIVYTITRKPDDELPIVVDEDGLKYKDNRYTLVILKDGTTLFNKSFTKSDFRAMINKDFQKYAIMDGLRFDRAEDGKLLFNTSVSYPESDMSAPFILTIGPDGSHSIVPDTSIDEDVPAPTPVEDTTV